MKFRKLTVFTVLLLCCASLCGCSQLGRIEWSKSAAAAAQSAEQTVTRSADVFGEFDAIDISWAAGTVVFVYDDCDCIHLEESAPDPIPASDAMFYTTEGKTLKIRFTKDTKLINLVSVNIRKQLTVTVPRNLKLSRFVLNSASADLLCEELNAEQIRIDAASGAVSLRSCTGNTVEIDTASGDIDLTAAGVLRELKLETASGKIRAAAETVIDGEIDSSSGDVVFEVISVDELDIETSSGDIDLKIPESLGASFEVTCNRNQFESDLAMVHRDDEYVYGSGRAEIKLESASGTVQVNAIR